MPHLIFVIFDEESELHIIAFLWLNVCHTRFDIFRERLTFYDVMTKNGTTQAGAGVGSIRTTNESKSFVDGLNVDR